MIRAVAFIRWLSRAGLDVAALHDYLLSGQGLAMSDASGAAAYAEGVASAVDSPLWEHALQHQIFLGDAGFVERMQALATPAGLTTREVPRPQRSRP